MLLFTGCEDKEQASPYLALDKDELSQSFAATAGTKEITLFSNLEVTTGISPAEATAWCRFSLKNVTEDESVLTISVDENTVKQGRKATITLTASDYRNVKVDVIQSGIILPIRLTGFEPQNGGKGDIVTLKGENLGDIAANLRVSFGTTVAEILSASDTELQVKVPKITNSETCKISVELDKMKEAYTDDFMYEKRWWIENLKVDVLPSAIAVDDAGKNILFLRRFPDDRIPAELGLYRLSETGEVSFLAGYDRVAGGYGFTSVVYDNVSKKFYTIAECGGTAIQLIVVDPANNWSTEVKAVEAGIDGYWGVGLTASKDGKLYTRQGWTNTVIEIDPSAWTAKTIGLVERHGSQEFSTALAVATGTNHLYVQIRSTSELAYIDVTTGEVTWLNTSTEIGYWDGAFAEARFLRGEQMCSDDEGNIYIVDQDNHAIRMVNDIGVSTVIGGNGSGAVNGIGKDAKLCAPSGLCMDANGVMYIGDTWNACIRKAVFE
ncbi:IPT/TIG domain-containing protein [Bacteroides acidifaciens]